MEFIVKIIAYVGNVCVTIESQTFLQRLRYEYLCNNFRINFIFWYKVDNSLWKLKYWKSDLSRSVLQRKS